MTRLSLALLFGLCLVGCEPATPPATPETTPTQETFAPATPDEIAVDASEAESVPASLMAQIRVVNLLTGAAMPNMTPIATTEPNAFDAPVATGNDTDTEGNSTIRVPADQHLYVRAWDPGLNFFPNNFYEVLPGGATIPNELVIQMVPASSLTAQFVLPDDQLAADTRIGLMLFHPTRGAWWPTEGRTNSEGVVTFEHLPAGEYVLRFRTEAGARLEHGQTALPPTNRVELGILSLQ